MVNNFNLSLIWQLTPWWWITRVSVSILIVDGWCLEKWKTLTNKQTRKQINGQLLLPWWLPSLSLRFHVESRQCFRSAVNRKSVQARWIMVMSQRPGAWWEWRWMCGGWSGWKWGRLWKYDGLEFKLSLTAQRLSESYLTQINFVGRSAPANLSVCLRKLKSSPPKKEHFSTRTFAFFPSCIHESLTDWQVFCKGHCSASVFGLCSWASIIKKQNKIILLLSSLSSFDHAFLLIFMSCGREWRSAQETGECPPLSTKLHEC